MRRVCQTRAFSINELLVVIGIILILVSLLVVTVSGVYSSAVQLDCQHRLEQILQADQMFASRNRGQWVRSYDQVTYRRWYDTLMDGYEV